MVVLIALIGEQVLTTQRLEQQANAYRTESERIFRQVLPQFKRIPSQSYLKNQGKFIIMNKLTISLFVFN